MLFKKNKEMEKMKLKELEERIEELEYFTPTYKRRKTIEPSLTGLLEEVCMMKRFAKEALNYGDYRRQVFYYFVAPIINNIYNYEEYEDIIVFLTNAIWKAKENDNEEV